MLPKQNNSKKWNDVSFAILFYISIVFNVLFAGYGIMKYKSQLLDTKNSLSFDIKVSDIVIILISCTISSFFAIFWVFILSFCTKAMIKASLIFETVMWFGLTILSIFLGGILAAIAPIIMFIIRLIWMWYVWNKIPFCEALLTTALNAFKKHWTPIFIHLFMAFISFLMLIIDMIGFLTANQISGSSSGQTAIFSLGFVSMLFLIWHSLVFTNVAIVTSCGVMVSWINKEAVSILDNFINASTILFGSICFGTFLEAVILTLRWIASQRQSDQNSNSLQLCLWCCLECLLRILGDILEYLNSYAFVYVAKNKSSYLQSAKEVFQMFKKCGFCMYFIYISILSTVFSFCY